MSGDLEDFLRRAAQRRQAKAAQQGASPRQEAPRQRPQYSNRHTERVVDAIVVEEAELVEEHVDSLAEQKRRLDSSRQAAAKVEADLAKRKKVGSKGGKSGKGGGAAATAVALSGVAGEDLLQLLRNPNGIKQAILLREIFDRPEHRW